MTDQNNNKFLLRYVEHRLVSTNDDPNTNPIPALCGIAFGCFVAFVSRRDYGRSLAVSTLAGLSAVVLGNTIPSLAFVAPAAYFAVSSAQRSGVNVW